VIWYNFFHKNGRIYTKKGAGGGEAPGKPKGTEVVLMPSVPGRIQSKRDNATDTKFCKILLGYKS